MSDYRKDRFRERRTVVLSSAEQEERPKVHITSKGARYVDLEELAKSPVIHRTIRKVANMTFGSRAAKESSGDR